MELMYNELSIDALAPDKYAANAKMKLFSETVAEARQRGFRNIRSHHDSHQIQLANGYSLYDWFHNKDVSEILRNNMYGMLILPFIRDEDEEVAAQYVEADYYFEDAANGIAKTRCTGLAAAHLYETLSVSLQSGPAWTKNLLEITVEAKGAIAKEQVDNIFSRECFALAAIGGIVENLGELNLLETAIAIKEKKIHLTSHHGQQELKALWNKLKNSTYVTGALSIEWGGKRFIRKTFANGEIEIVDTGSDQGYALLVQTTGRNMRETNAIAEILKDKYE
jgi:hypothetical protein